MTKNYLMTEEEIKKLGGECKAENLLINFETVGDLIGTGVASKILDGEHVDKYLETVDKNYSDLVNSYNFEDENGVFEFLESVKSLTTIEDKEEN